MRYVCKLGIWRIEFVGFEVDLVCVGLVFLGSSFMLLWISLISIFYYINYYFYYL